MFTGLVQTVGRIASTQPSDAGMRLLVDCGGWGHTPSLGDSISVNGCCLTVAAIDNASGGRVLSFDAIPETLAKTTLGKLVAGSGVNLEHSLRADSLLGGHVVQGHVDGVGEVTRVETDGEWRIRITPPHSISEFLTPKGSVCIEGVSLTIAALSGSDEPAWFEVALIPETLERTTLEDLKSGDPVNLEADVMAKTIVHWLKQHAARLLGSQGG